MPKHLNFESESPVSPGEVYDLQNGTLYIWVYAWGDLYKDNIEDTINHGVLHYTIQKLEGNRTSFKFDEFITKLNLQNYKIFKLKLNP